METFLYWSLYFGGNELFGVDGNNLPLHQDSQAWTHSILSETPDPSSVLEITPLSCLAVAVRDIFDTPSSFTPQSSTNPCCIDVCASFSFHCGAAALSQMPSHRDSWNLQPFFPTPVCSVPAAEGNFHQWQTFGFRLLPVAYKVQHNLVPAYFLGKPLPFSHPPPLAHLSGLPSLGMWNASCFHLWAFALAVCSVWDALFVLLSPHLSHSYPSDSI